MTSEWRTIRAADFIDFNPRLSLKKGDIATKVAMDKLKPFTKKIPETEKAEFNSGAKFCNGDTVMARITPCLENGKTAYVDMLDDGEIGFGSTEFIVMRAKTGISDPQFVYYTAISPVFRNVAIKSMVGSSGRQRVQQSVLEELWSITDETGAAVDTLSDGALYELRVSVADGGAFDLSEAEKEIKISVVLAK